MRFILTCCLPAVLLKLAFTTTTVAAALSSSSNNKKDINDLEYRVYPKRTPEEAAVLEWGHSAIISALDASVATFGPQTTDAALLEVECTPVLASPLNGVSKSGLPVNKFDNSEETHGNMVVMTNTGNLSGKTMARIAMNSGAAALLVVNMDEDHPDDIYRLTLGNDDEAEDDDDDEDVESQAQTGIDIPVCMISLNSANVLTTATVTPDMKPEDIVNNGMPDRVRLYAGDDRPFFEDVEPFDPTLYLIHNLMTDDECIALERQAAKAGSDIESALMMSHDTSKMQHMESVVLWKGTLQTHAGKQVEERIEQVTGFPATHYSDFCVYKVSNDSHWKPHYDVFVNGQVPMATITIFLTDTDSSSGSTEDEDDSSSSQPHPVIVYPSLDKPVKILPRKGMAIVHHNLDNQNQQLDLATLSAWLSASSSSSSDNDDGTDRTVYVARKYVFAIPPSTAKRMVLPMLAVPLGGKLPTVVYQLYAWLVSKFGYEQGDLYFDKLCVFVPLLLVLGTTQVIVNYVRDRMSKKNNNNSSNSKSKKE